MSGAANRPVISIEIAVDDEPVTLPAVTVKVVADCELVGVPEITPDEVLRVRPAGKAGETDQLVTAPPAFAGETVVAA